MSTVNRTMKAWYTMILMNEYVFRVAARGKHLYNKFLTPDELQTMLEESKYNVTHTSRIYSNIILSYCSR